LCSLRQIRHASKKLRVNFYSWHKNLSFRNFIFKTTIPFDSPSLPKATDTITCAGRHNFRANRMRSRYLHAIPKKGGSRVPAAPSSLTVIGRLVCNCRRDRIGLKAEMHPPKTDGGIETLGKYWIRCIWSKENRGEEGDARQHESSRKYKQNERCANRSSRETSLLHQSDKLSRGILFSDTYSRVYVQVANPVRRNWSGRHARFSKFSVITKNRNFMQSERRYWERECASRNFPYAFAISEKSFSSPQ